MPCEVHPNRVGRQERKVHLPQPCLARLPVERWPATALLQRREFSIIPAALGPSFIVLDAADAAYQSGSVCLGGGAGVSPRRFLCGQNVGSRVSLGIRIGCC